MSLPYEVCANAPNFPQCNAVYQDPVLKIQRIPDPPIVPLWTKAMTNLFQNNPDLNPDVLNLPPIPPAPVSGGGANWASTSNITAPSYTKTPVWDVTDPYVEACSCPPGKWAVTYDDGPLQYEAEFLATLASMNVKASFFVLGSNVLNYQQSLKDAYAAGHQIGIHTWTHPYTTTRSTDEIVAETIYAAMAIYSVIGQVPRYWRPPKGDIDNRVRGIMSALGLRVAMWNVDSKDWTINGTGQLYPWTAQNATDVLASVFKYGYYVNYWGGGGDISTPALWTNLTWLPGGPNYQGFISLEHELTDGDHALSVQYLNTIFNTPFTHFNPGTNPNGGKFVPALFYECDQALGAAATPYLSTADPFYNLVTYWYSKLPITQAVMSATDGVYQFGQPVANTTDPLSTGGSGNGGGGVTAGGASGTPGASVTATSTKKSSGPAMVEVSRGGVLAVVVTVVAVLAAVGLA